MKYACTYVDCILLASFFYYESESPRFCFYSLVRANEVFTRLLPASWNAYGESRKNPNVLLYLALPSFSSSSPIILARSYFGLLFYESHRCADPRVEYIYQWLWFSKRIKKLTHVWFTSHPCLCCYLIKHGPSFSTSKMHS